MDAPDPSSLPSEDPVMLLIISESGFTLFSHQFKGGKQLDEQIVGPMLTTLSQMGKDVFSSIGMDRIMVGNHTILMKPLESLLACYIFQGPSYLALQKLDQFLTRIQESPLIFHALSHISPPSLQSPRRAGVPGSNRIDPTHHHDFSYLSLLTPR